MPDRTQPHPSVTEQEKPWGRFEQYAHNLPCTVKVITVEPGGTLSRQFHHHRDELWVILDHGAEVEIGDRTLRPEREEKLFIPRLTHHRLCAVGDEAIRVLEVSFGVFDEDDIVRLEDIYGRAGSANGAGPATAPATAEVHAAVDGRSRKP